MYLNKYFKPSNTLLHIEQTATNGPFQESEMSCFITAETFSWRTKLLPIHSKRKQIAAAVLTSFEVILRIFFVSLKM